MKNLILPDGYFNILDLETTEKAIKMVKDYFEDALAEYLNLRRVTAPMIVMSGTGINDDLNGIERPVSFPVKGLNDQRAEVVHSLAKWKRLMLSELCIQKPYGLYTDMNALRPDEDLDNIHSVYVDQWDWEKVISPDDRNLKILKETVRLIYEAIKKTEFAVFEEFGELEPMLPDEIYFIHSEELLQLYPNLSPKQREHAIAKEKGAVFITGIGHQLSHGQVHDGRAPDYDDWSSTNEDGLNGLNGDILLWYPLLNRSIEVSSMGIRVDKNALKHQLQLTGQEHRSDLFFHKRLLKGTLPQSMGGGIGQSRLCMILLRKAHIGEVQSSIWPDEMRKLCAKHDIHLI
ncbi:MAG: aspartate--ammonia ligase [Cyclobacteriaceae bacterium]|nr:aspartate--ammonia ligase [Cyclobacteriaceae bacterium]